MTGDFMGPWQHHLIPKLQKRRQHKTILGDKDWQRQHFVTFGANLELFGDMSLTAYRNANVSKIHNITNNTATSKNKNEPSNDVDIKTIQNMNT